MPYVVRRTSYIVKTKTIKAALVIFEIMVGAGEGAAAGDSAGVVLESQTDRTQITIGDQIRYTVTITGPAGTAVEMPGLGVQLGQFEIKDYAEKPVESLPGKRERRVVEYLISTYAVGKYVIPPLPVRYSLPGDSTPRVLLADRIEVEVKPVPASDTTDIVEIAAPVPAGRSRARLGVALSLLALLLAGAGAYLWRQRRALRARLRPPPPPRPPHEIALAELEALERSEDARREDSRPYYLALSAIQRRYLHGRYGLDALESTTEELAVLLRERHFADPDVRTVIGYCRALDLVKFAKQPAPPELRREHTGLLRKYILDTKTPETAPVAPSPSP